MKSIVICYYRMAIHILLKAGGFRWIVSAEDDPGFRVFGVEVYYYKWDDEPLVYIDSAGPKYRLACKWEITLDVDVWNLWGSPVADKLPMGEKE